MQLTRYHANRIGAKVKNLHTSDKQEVFFDPATITLITTIVLQVIKLIKHCTKDSETPEKEALEVAHRPSYRAERQLNRILRKKLGWKKYWKEGTKYKEAILDEGKTLTKEDILGLYTDEEQQALYIGPGFRPGRNPNLENS